MRIVSQLYVRRQTCHFFYYNYFSLLCGIMALRCHLDVAVSCVVLLPLVVDVPACYMASFRAGLPCEQSYPSMRLIVTEV